MASTCGPGKLCFEMDVLLRWAALTLAGLVLLAPGNAAGESTEPLKTQDASPPASNVDSDRKSALRALGLEYGFIYTGEVLSNTSGGLKQGTIYDGKLEAFVKADLAKIVGWEGLTFYANAFQLNSTGRLRRDYVGSLITITNIEALPTTRLSELWLEQKLLGGAVTVRAGQLAADVEFFFSTAGNFFVNSDWPTITSANLPSGGPAYPLSTPGVRFKFEPTKDTSILLAVFNGDPAGPGPAGEQEERNRFGLNFRIQDPPFVIAEMQFRSKQGMSEAGLAWTLKLGGWVHFGRFDDQRFGVDGLSLASPLSSHVPLQHFGNEGIYAVVDQQLYRPVGGDDSSGLVAYSRVSLSPSNVNLIQSYFEGGLIASGLIPGRLDDKFGAAFIYAGISDAVSALDRDAILASSTRPARDYEASLELSYQAQIQPGWILQPLFTHVWHPSGSSAVPDATIVGVRTVITY